MNKNFFKDLGIITENKPFTGDKIKIIKILNREITVHDYKIQDSKFEGKRLDLSIELNGIKHVTWTCSKIMMNTIQQVPKDKFPFITTIIEDNGYHFT